MLQKSASVFAVVVAFLLAVVCSQPLPERSPLSNARTEEFSHELLRLLEGTAAISLPPWWKISDPYQSIFVESYAILLRTGITDPTLAEEAGRAAVQVSSVLDLSLEYSALSHMIAKEIDLNGALTQDVIKNGPRRALAIVESYAARYGTGDVSSALFVVSNGLYDYLNSLGLATERSITDTFDIYNYYLVKLGQDRLQS